MNMKMKNHTTVTVLTLFLCSFYLGVYKLYPLTQRPNILITQQDSVINFNEGFMEIIGGGFKRMLSSLLWVETLLRSDLEHYNEDDLNNWMYRRLNLITNLDKRFYEAYIFGAIYLSIVKDDEKAALLIYRKGLNEFPDDYFLNFNIAFHLYFEMNEAALSIPHFEKTVDDPRAPKYLKSLIAKLKSESGNLLDAQKIMTELWKNTPEQTVIKKKYENNLYAIKAELDLDCLNKQKPNCPRNDFRGSPYLKVERQWLAKDKWIPFRPKKKKSPSN